MSMKKIILFTGILLNSLLAFSQSDTLYTPGGMAYRVFSGGSDKTIPMAHIVKFNVRYLINDSVYYNSFGRVPAYSLVNTPVPYDMSELWPVAHIGDSIVSVQSMDTFIRRNPDAKLTFKKTDKIFTYIKVLNVFPTDAAATADNQLELKAYLNSEIAFLEKYLASKKIKVTKTASGAFVQVIAAGTGPAAFKGKSVTVNYTGKTLAGKKFDSNIEKSFNHVQPLAFIIGDGTMIKGFDEGVMNQKSGAVLRIYIPSLLGYGSNPQPASGIKPYEHLIFDIKLLGVTEPKMVTKEFRPKNNP